MMCCTCNPKPRTVKTRRGTWICAACHLERAPRVTYLLREQALIRHDPATGGRIWTNLQTFQHDLGECDATTALRALLARGEALTPAAAYELRDAREVSEPAPASIGEALVAEAHRVGWPLIFRGDLVRAVRVVSEHPELYGAGFGWLLAETCAHVFPPEASELIEDLALAYPDARWYFGREGMLVATSAPELVQRLDTIRLGAAA